MRAVPFKYQAGKLEILDQTRIPWEERMLPMDSKEDLWEAIQSLRVRGAPAIGVCAAFGILSLAYTLPEDTRQGFRQSFRDLVTYLSSARPTAVNLSWALSRMEQGMLDFLQESDPSLPWIKQRPLLLGHLERQAEDIRKEDADACLAMGEYGLSLLRPGMGLMTYCNAGALATAGYGTSLAPIHLGQEREYRFRVYACETRPLMQGARLTSWELLKAGVDTTLLCDNMAASVMQKGLVDAVLVGCDRLAANGDGANKIGTAGLAILAREFGIPFYMFVPTSTIDRSCRQGREIPVECRDPSEVTGHWFEKPMAPQEVKVYNPSFDVNDARHITAIITEKGIVRPPYPEGLARLMNDTVF